MIDLKKLRTIEPRIVTVGSYPAIFQAILDFDYLSGRKTPSIVGIIATGRRFERCFFGRKEVLIPVYSAFEQIPQDKREEINLFLNVSSARRVLSYTKDAFKQFPRLLGGVVFAEDVPERHAIELSTLFQEKKKFIIGPASVGILIPGVLKLGAIGGTDYKQLVGAHLFERGNVAVFSASGGMTNEIINIVTKAGKRLSFSLHFGGDRFPITEPIEAFELTQNDPKF